MTDVTQQNLDFLTVLMIVSSVIAVIAILWMLFVKPHILHPLKRIGLALIGSGILMTIGSTAWAPSPFAQWTGVLVRVGVFVLVVGYGMDHHLLPQLGRMNEWDVDRKIRMNGGGKGGKGGEGGEGGAGGKGGKGGEGGKGASK